MITCRTLVIIYCISTMLPLLSFCDELIDDKDIPVVEGDGGVIKTAVENDVLILTKENFDLQVHSKETVLVEFYAPWCGHCKALEPEYSKAAKMLKEEKSPIYLAKVDATIETELSTRFDISGYPTLLIFKKGEKVLYDGPRTALGIVEYMKERADPKWKPPPEAVITLTEENFDKVVKMAEIILVEFYAPWCGHCKQLAPEYERAAKVLKDSVPSIPLAKVNGIEEDELAKKYETKGWPTLLIFRKGKKYSYEGPRDESGIISYMKEQAKPPSLEVNSIKVLEKAIGKVYVVIGFFYSETDSSYQNFKDAAYSLQNKFRFLHSFNTQVMQDYGYGGGPNTKFLIVIMPDHLHSQYEMKNFVLIDDELSTSKITEFIMNSSMPLVGERNHKSQWTYQNKYPLVVVYYDVDFSFDHRKQTQLIRHEVAKVAKDYKDKITFAVSNENEYQDELVQLNLDDSGEDVNVGYFESSKVRYRMEPVEDFNEEALREFVRGVLSGSLKKHIKSQAPPKENKGSVLTVVGSTFEKLVLKNKKDVFIELYAPWCGHCKKLEPIFKKLGKAFAKNNKVVIAKMDATANDFPDRFKVDGFPTLFYVPALDKNNIIAYDGERSLKDLTEFVNNQLSRTFEKDEL